MRVLCICCLVLISLPLAAQPETGPVFFLGYSSSDFDEVQRLWFRDAFIRKSRAAGKNVSGPMTVASIHNRYGLDGDRIHDSALFASIADDYGAVLVASGMVQVKDGKLILTLRAFTKSRRSLHETVVTLDSLGNNEEIEKRLTDSCYEKFFVDRGWLEK